MHSQMLARVQGTKCNNLGIAIENYMSVELIWILREHMVVSVLHLPDLAVSTKWRMNLYQIILWCQQQKESMLFSHLKAEKHI